MFDHADTVDERLATHQQCLLSRIGPVLRAGTVRSQEGGSRVVLSVVARRCVRSARPLKSH